MPDSRRPRRSRRYDDYSDSDSDYYSDDGHRTRHRARSLERDRDARRSKSQRHTSTRDNRYYDSDNDDRRRPRSVDRHHSSRDNRYHSRERDRDYGRDRSRGPEDESRNSQQKIQNAINAGLKAGALEAFRLRKEPGPWTGSKGVRIATAVFGAAMADTALQKGRDPDRNKKSNSAKATLSGLVLNRLLNGPRDKVGRR